LIKTTISTALAVLLIFAVSCSEDPVPEEVRLDSEATVDFEAAWRAANNMYPLFEFKNIDWDDVYERYRPRAEQTPPSGIYDLLDDLLAELKDAHVYYDHPLFGAWSPYVPRRITDDYDAFSLTVASEYFPYGFRRGGYTKVSYGVNDDNTGYIHVASLAIENMMDDFDDVMDYVRGTDGLILDFRTNLGGIQDNVDVLMSRFIGSTTASFAAFTVDGPAALPPYEPDTTRFTYTGPVVVLINGACASAPEAVTEMLQRLPNVTLMGDTTSGAGCWATDGHPGLVRLPSGRMVFIPTTCMLRQDGEPWERNGIAPDTRIVQTRQHIINRIDRQLEEALDLLK
jgi:hypothetical protein